MALSSIFAFVISWNEFLAALVIATSLLGVFLTVPGLYIGIARLNRRRSGRWSPYRGLRLWHHWLGLAFGALTLTWVGSGLLSVNPWGLLESPGTGAEREALRGRPAETADGRALRRRVGRHRPDRLEISSGLDQVLRASLAETLGVSPDRVRVWADLPRGPAGPEEQTRHFLFMQGPAAPADRKMRIEGRLPPGTRVRTVDEVRVEAHIEG